jgi:hypothetical protein
MSDHPHGHFWDYCALCQSEVVICGKCGNNCCNGGHGTLPDGSKCDACPSACEMQDKSDRYGKHVPPPGSGL